MSTLPGFLRELQSFLDRKSNEGDSILSESVHAELSKIMDAASRVNFERFSLTSEENGMSISSLEPRGLPGLKSILPFLRMKDAIESGCTVGTIIGEDQDALLFSQEIALKVYYLGEGMRVKPWGHLADELLISLCGKVSLGVEDEGNKGEDQSRRFHSSEPRFIQLLPESGAFLGLSLQWGALKGDYWLFTDGEHNVYDETIMKIDNVKDYYEDFAAKYEKNMRKWGYFLPRLVFSSLMRAVKPLPPKDSQILDLGCGDGLIGAEFHGQGYLDLTGFDFSPPMLAKAKEKNIYRELHQGDLLQTLPFGENAFDLLLCISVTTYIEPSVLEEWIRVVKPGGYLLFSHKSSVSVKWEPSQQRLAGEGRWRMLYVTDPPVMFLPLLKEGSEQKPCEERAKIYVYQKS